MAEILERVLAGWIVDAHVTKPVELNALVVLLNQAREQASVRSTPA